MTTDHEAPPRLRMLDALAAADEPVTRHVIAGRTVVFVSEPELVRDLLVTQAASLAKSEFQLRVMGGAEGAATGLGDGLLTSSNEVNARQRAVLRGLFGPPSVRRHVPAVAALARAERDRWAGGAPVAIDAALMGLSARIAARTLFSWDLAGAEGSVVESLTAIGDTLGGPAAARRSGLGDPSPLEGAAAHLEARLLALVGHRRRTGPRAHPDVIDALLAGPVTGVPLRDELMTLFITGAENPRNALTWAVYLLSRHAEVACRVRDEVDRAGAAEHLTADTLPRLPYTLRVFREAIRLYPPGYAFGRRVIRRVRAGDLILEPGDELVVSPYVMHRRPSLFPEPGEFRPDRFTRPPRPFSYLPFGAGPRDCVGGGLAQMTGHVVLATLLGGLTLGPTAGRVVPRPAMTLRPGGPVTVTAVARSSRA